MKINKLDEKLLEKVITEDEETVEIPEDTTVSDLTTGELTDIVKAEMGLTDEDSDADAKKFAAEVKDTAADIENDVEYAPIVSNNELVKTLDRVLAQSKRNRRSKYTKGAGCDVLVNGLPGSGKTGIVRDWAKARGCELAYVNAKDPELEIVVNGLTNLERDASGVSYTGKAYSRILDSLDRENSILFLDEFNRAPEQLRASLLTLINEHAVAGPGKDGYRHFPNLLFTIACINPSAPTDVGAIALNDAEKSRFKTKLMFDSTPARALNFYNEYFPAILADLDPASSDYVADYKFFAKAFDLAKFLVKDPSFDFDSRDDLEMLADYDATMLNQRSLTDGLISDGGEGKDVFIEWVEEQSGFLDRDIKMIKDILAKYTDIDPVVPKAGTTTSSTVTDNEEDDSTSKPVSTPTSTGTGDDIDDEFSDILSGNGEEIDSTLFGGGGKASGVVNVTPQDAAQRIKGFKW